MPKRRRGARSAARPIAASPAHTRFQRLVERAIAGIPDPFRAALAEVAIVIDDEPTAEQRRENDLADDDQLYGLYEGVPRTEYGADWAAVPNRITLFRLVLEEDFADPRELAEEVRLTVIHELAHHLGIDDDRLDELGV
ncbi:MAG TPA: metallopeptidase family protein [Candidatus Bathyarchaeia archaeon]|jgi:predicted Zn-dependent protease with MMP-like domain|nr:metallopeptidase family protein [Candidatus Bathyarchaeia archaeon]